MIRFAVVDGGSVTQVEAYLPANYKVVGTAGLGHVLIAGEDNAGWTLDGYVLPRLASGLYFGKELVKA